MRRPNSGCIPVSSKIPMPEDRNTQKDVSCSAFSSAPLPFPIPSLPPPQARRFRKARLLCFDEVPFFQNPHNFSVFFEKMYPKRKESSRIWKRGLACCAGRFKAGDFPVRRSCGTAAWFLIAKFYYHSAVMDINSSVWSSDTALNRQKKQLRRGRGTVIFVFLSETSVAVKNYENLRNFQFSAGNILTNCERLVE